MTTPKVTFSVADPGWVPESCTLPTVEQPLRVAEFDDLFAGSLRAIERPDRTTARLILDAAAIDRARELAAREVGCCSFFTFELTPGGLVPGPSPTTVMQVGVPASQTAVLDALTSRAAAAAGLPDA